MHKRAGELDESLVKTSILAVAVEKPQILQHVVRFVKFLLVEQREIAGVTRVNAVAGKLRGQLRHADRALIEQRQEDRQLREGEVACGASGGVAAAQYGEELGEHLL